MGLKDSMQERLDRKESRTCFLCETWLNQFLNVILHGLAIINQKSFYLFNGILRSCIRFTNDRSLCLLSRSLLSWSELISTANLLSFKILSLNGSFIIKIGMLLWNHITLCMPKVLYRRLRCWPFRGEKSKWNKSLIFKVKEKSAIIMRNECICLTWKGSIVLGNHEGTLHPLIAVFIMRRRPTSYRHHSSWHLSTWKRKCESVWKSLRSAVDMKRFISRQSGSRDSRKERGGKEETGRKARASLVMQPNFCLRTN